jgi:hypothetical protein
MFPNTIEPISKLPGPLLTVYLDTDQGKQTNRGLKPGYLIRLESQAKAIAQTIPPKDQDLFREQLERTKAYLQSRPPQCRSVVIFAGSESWEFFPLQVEAEDEVHWGTPALAQLLWLFEEHKPYGIVVPGRKEVRYFLYRLGETRELEKEEFRLQPSKEKEMGPVSRVGVRVSGGTNRDVFEHHVDAEYAHYHQQIAERIERWCTAEQLESVFLVGLAEMVKAIRKEIPPALVEKIVLVEGSLGWESPAELLDRVEPMVVCHKRKCEMASVEAMLGDERNAVIGIDEVLAQLQQGRIRRVVVTKGLDGSLQQCMNCLWTDRSSDPVCSVCRGQRKQIGLRDGLPELVRRFNGSLEVVSGEAARKLQGSGGMGAWLREFEKKEYSAFA